MKHEVDKKKRDSEILGGETWIGVEIGTATSQINKAIIMP